MVDGVLASTHSKFVLDDLTPQSLRHLLPAIYQALFIYPVSLLCHALGPANSALLADTLVPLVNNHMAHIQATMLAVATLAALGLAKGVSSRIR